MFKLIRLELKKYKNEKNVRAAGIACAVMLGVMLLIAFASKTEPKSAFSSFSDVLTLVDTIVRDVFVIFAAVMLGEYVIGEYKNKTITVLFTYPVNRKRIIAAKLIIISIFIFLSIIFSDIVISLVMYMANKYMHFVQDNVTMELIFASAGSMVLNAAAASGMSLIPLYFGMRKKSAAATIVASIILVSIVGSNNGGFSLSSIVIIPISLAFVGIFSAYMSVRKLELIDV